MGLIQPISFSSSSTPSTTTRQRPAHKLATRCTAQLDDHTRQLTHHPLHSLPPTHSQRRMNPASTSSTPGPPTHPDARERERDTRGSPSLPPQYGPDGKLKTGNAYVNSFKGGIRVETANGGERTSRACLACRKLKVRARVYSQCDCSSCCWVCARRASLFVRRYFDRGGGGVVRPEGLHALQGSLRTRLWLMRAL